MADSYDGTQGGAFLQHRYDIPLVFDNEPAMTETHESVESDEVCNATPIPDNKPTMADAHNAVKDDEIKQYWWDATTMSDNKPSSSGTYDIFERDEVGSAAEVPDNKPTRAGTRDIFERDEVRSTTESPDSMPTIEETYAMAQLYLQIDENTNPASILGVSESATAAEIQKAYHAIALKIHPDKCPSHLQAWHTKLFQKLQKAYVGLKGYDVIEPGDPRYGEAGVSEHECLLETEFALHQRNCDFKERLKAARVVALNWKRAEDARKAAIDEKYRRLAEKREGRAAENEAKELQGQQRIKREKGILTQPDRQPTVVDAEDENEDSSSTQGRPAAYKQKTTHKTNSSASKELTTLKDDLFIPPLPKADGQGRWYKQLLSGGKSGSLSFQEREWKLNNSAARKSLLLEQGYTKEADAMLMGALAKGATFSGSGHEDWLCLAQREMREGFDHGQDQELLRLDRVTQNQYLEFDLRDHVGKLQQLAIDE